MFALSRTKVIASFPAIRALSTTGRLHEIFKIQSMEEFDEKVRNSKKPVIVDFFAT